MGQMPTNDRVPEKHLIGATIKRTYCRQTLDAAAVCDDDDFAWKQVVGEMLEVIHK